jgi:hypothetical protein
MDAGIPMPALVFLMPMPSYADKLDQLNIYCKYISSLTACVVAYRNSIECVNNKHFWSYCMISFAVGQTTSKSISATAVHWAPGLRLF